MARMTRLTVALASLLVVPSLFAEGVLIRCNRPCTKEINAVKKAGGHVTYEYQYVDGIAAEIPVNAASALRAAVGEDRIEKDEMIPMPAPVVDRDGVAGEALA